ANPTETLEYAPVPPSDDDPPPPPAVGNLGSLGLASSAGIVSGPSATGVGTGGTGKGPGPAPAADDAPPPPAAVLPPAIKTPSTKRCIGKPPRQTEDPLAPPCVASFAGDNFGATYQGVSKDEVNALFYFDAPINDLGTSRGTEARPVGQYFDLANPPSDDDH